MTRPHITINWSKVGQVIRKALWKTFVWILFTVIASCLPLVLTLGFYMITEKHIDEVKYIRDIMLVAYTIVVSLFAMSLDLERNLKLPTRTVFACISFFSALICGGIYFSIFGMNISGEDVPAESFWTFFYIALGLSVLHFLFVIIIEVISSIRDIQNAAT